jgi:hypothetical protein
MRVNCTFQKRTAGMYRGKIVPFRKELQAGNEGKLYRSEKNCRQVTRVNCTFQKRIAGR